MSNFNEGGQNHPSSRKRNELEKVEPYDWALDLELNPDWALWGEEYLKYSSRVFKRNK